MQKINKFKVFTNLEFSQEEVKEINSSFTDKLGIEIFSRSIIKKGLGVKEITEFIFRDIDIFTIIRGGLIFNFFIFGIKKLWALGKKKKPQQEVSGWITCDSVNIILPGITDIGNALDKLPSIIEKINQQKVNDIKENPNTLYIYHLTFKQGQWKLTKI